MDFLRLSKRVLLLKFPLFSEDPGQIEKFTYMPLDGRKAPRKIKALAMRPLAMGRRRLRPIPGEPAAGSAGGLVRKACVFTLGQFVTGVGAERPPASAGGDAETTRLPLPKCQRSTGQGAAWRGLGTCGGVRRGLR
jgi:hypothetical protein